MSKAILVRRNVVFTLTLESNFSLRRRPRRIQFDHPPQVHLPASADIPILHQQHLPECRMRIEQGFVQSQRRPPAAYRLCIVPPI